MSKNITESIVLAKLKNPIRHEPLAKALGVTTAETGPVLRKLVAAGKVKQKGKLRATTYQAK